MFRFESLEGLYSVQMYWIKQIKRIGKHFLPPYSLLRFTTINYNIILYTVRQKLSTT